MKYLRFLRVPSREIGKTQVWDVLSVRQGDVLGTISWFGRWRQYAFFPSGNTIYNPVCLHEIAAFAEGLMAERKSALVLVARQGRQRKRGESGFVPEPS